MINKKYAYYYVHLTEKVPCDFNSNNFRKAPPEIVKFPLLQEVMSKCIFRERALVLSMATPMPPDSPFRENIVAKRVPLQNVRYEALMK